MIRHRSAFLLLWPAIFLHAALYAQPSAANSQPSEMAAKASSTLATDPKKDPPKPGFLAHRIQFLALDLISQSRYMDAGPGQVTSRDEFYKLSTRVQLNLTGDGNTYLQARGESGRIFQFSYDYTGFGLHPGYWSYNLKSLFLGQNFGPHLEAQAGGIEYDQGVGTEATYNDNDGWLEGYRLRYTGLGHYLPHKISVTVGYAGDLRMPNFFARAPRMAEENYIQVLAQQKFTKTLELSASYDSIQGIRYCREAFRWQKLPIPVVSPDLAIEALTRASDNPTFGWFGSLARNLDHKGRYRPGMYYLDLPRGMFQLGANQIFFNGDCYSVGKHIGPTFRYAPLRDLDITFFGSDRLDNTPGIRYRGQMIVRYQFAGLMNRAMRVL